MKRIFLICLSAVSLFAADVTGKWTAAIEGPQGQMELLFDFKQEGEKLTGTSQSPMGEMTISEGKVEGDVITFTVATDQFKVVHKGKVEGDQIKVTVEIGDRQMDFVAKRAK